MSTFDERDGSAGRKRRTNGYADDRSQNSLQNENGPISQRDRRNRDRKTPMEERGTPTRNNHDSDAEMEEDVDVKKMKVNFDETTQIMEVVKEFELDYASSKQSVNQFDETGLINNVTIKTIKQCYKVVKENVYKENPAFDSVKMEPQIHECLVSVTTCQKDLNFLKGEYYSVNETVINKDINIHKIDHVKRARAKQLLVLDKFDTIEVVMQENSKTVAEVENKYFEFEDDLFKNQMEATHKVVEQVNNLMEEIDQQMDKMTQDLITVKQDVSNIAPQSQEQINKLNKINSDIAHVEKILETADESMDRNDQDKEKYQTKYTTNQEAVEKYAPCKLVEMVSQTRLVVDLVQNQSDWHALYKKLKNLKDEQIQIGEFDLQKIMADAKKHAESVFGGRKDEFDDLIKKIQKAAKKIRDDAEEQLGRLNDFENKNLKSDMANILPDGDFLFLNKEVTRYRGSLQTVLASKDNTLDESVKIDADLKDSVNKGENITQENLHSLKGNLKSLEKHLLVDVPRIKKNIDMLEAYAIKALKNKLNDDNKKSQNQISQMKRNYEDLQKEIDALNTKLGKVRNECGDLKGRLDNEDMEKDNEIYHKIEDKLNECDKDINGDKAEKADTTERDPTKPPSLQARKKEIIAAINKMVNLFNENNKQIKDSNKVPKTEKEMNDLIVKNQEIQDDCQRIDDKVTDGKIFAGQIDERLNLILDPVIPELEAKYEDKNALIDECDELFDNSEAKIKDMEAKLDDILASVDDTIAKLENASPIANPSSAKADNKDFLDKMGDLNDKSQALRDKLEKMQEKLGETKDKMMDIIQPLNELGDREVKKPEIAKVLDQLKNINDAIRDIEGELGNGEDDAKDLAKEVEDLLDSEKEKKIGDADQKIKDLDRTLADLDDLKADAQKKLDEYNDMIAEAKANEGQDDPQLAGKLAQLEKEAKAIQDQINDIDDKAKDIKKKRDDAKAMIDDAYANPDKFNPAQIDGILDGVDDLQGKVDDLNDKTDRIDKDLDKRMKDLQDLLDGNRAKKGLDAKMAEDLASMKDNLSKIKDVLRNLPGKIALALKTCEEMKKGSLPDETADYWEERKNIDQWIANLKNAEKELEEVEALFKEKEAQLKEFNVQSKKALELPAQEKLSQQMDKEAQEIQALAEKCFDAQDLVFDTIKDMDDCQIPVNRQMRANEIDQFGERLDQILDEFSELKQADADFEGTSESEKEIKGLISTLDKKLRGFEGERKDHEKYQKNKLDAYTEQDIFNEKQQPVIIKEIRLFKEKIEDTNERLKELDELMRDLNTKLIQQDMANATKLLGKKAGALKDRLQIAESELKKISETGDKMEGNTSMNEEEEFLDALKEEMPEVFKNIEGNFKQLDQIDDLIEKVEKNKNIEDMQELKKQIDDSTTKVEQCEGLVNKLENEIIEWDAFKKLCRRDEELGEIDNLLGEFNRDLGKEIKQMEGAKAKQQNLLDNSKDQQDKDDAQYLIDGCDNYTNELAKLNEDVQNLQGEKDECFGEFDEDIPSIVKVARNKRRAAAYAGKKNKPADLPTTSDKPEDMYYMLMINCRYRRRIHDMLKNLRNINQRRRELAEKYAGLKKDLAVEKQVKIFKAVKGDAVDELWCFHLNKHQLDLEVKRLGPGKYLFGTRNIMAKIINGKLVIRVGGGYMGADEFIEQYGKMEMLKMMHNAEVMEQRNNPDFDGGSDKGCDKGSNRSLGRRGSGARQSVMPPNVGSMADMKAQLMANVKTYDSTSQNLRGTFDEAGARQNRSPGPGSRKTVNLGAGGLKGLQSRSPGPQARQSVAMGSPKGLGRR